MRCDQPSLTKDVYKRQVLESKVVNIEIADKVLMEVECNNGVIESIDELERIYRYRGCRG